MSSGPGERRYGLPLRSASEALRGAPAPITSPVPLPAGSPGRATAEQVGFTDPGTSFSFYLIGDSGGVQVPTPQFAVVHAMVECAAQDQPAFLFHVGDMVYYGGALADWGPQFYEPLASLRLPVVGLGGNHDDPRGGDPPIPDVASQPPLVNWMANMCSRSPTIPAVDPEFEYGRDTQTQPYCDWTLTIEGLTIVGAWSNVPSGGDLTTGQIDWLTSELQAAPADRPCLLAVHHPPLSVDTFHGGSQRMSDWLTGIFQTAERVPELCLFGHVHNYQRFAWQVAGGQTTAIISGNGGYHNLHAIASDYQPGMQVADDVVCEYADGSEYGFVRITVSGGTVTGEYVGVKPGTMPDGSDATYSRGVDTF
jgi:acid phosphatase type 7